MSLIRSSRLSARSVGALFAVVGSAVIGLGAPVLRDLTSAKRAIAAAPQSAQPASGLLHGVVYRDMDLDGLRDQGEPGVLGAWLKLTGTMVGPDGLTGTRDDISGAPRFVVTSLSGEWAETGTLSDSGGARAELLGLDNGDNIYDAANESTLPTGTVATAGKGESGSNVEFVAFNGAAGRAGIYEPSSYCGTNATIVTTCFTLGAEPTYPHAISTFKSTLDGPKTAEATLAQVGATYGLAANRDGNIFAGTFVKRHTAYGPAGNVNAIYNLKSGGNDTPTLFTVLPGTLTPHGNDLQIDDEVYDRVGKEGLGDIDSSADGSQLYAVNLSDQRLYVVPVLGTGAGVSAGIATSEAIPSPVGCIDPRPFGLGVKDGLVYVGGVCSAESTVQTVLKGDRTKLSSYIFQFNPTATAKTFEGSAIAPNTFSSVPVFEAPLNYSRVGGGYCNRVTKNPCNNSEWYPWSTLWGTQAPQLADIDVTTEDLILGFRDRFGDQSGFGARVFNSELFADGASAGDILLACKSETGWQIENNGSCNSTKNGTYTGTPNNEQGPGGGEFFVRDDWRNNDVGHGETAQGGFGYVSGLGLVVGAMDAADWFSTGVIGISLNGGSRWGAYELQPNAATSGQAGFGKSNGIGDVEVLCNSAPVEIGDRVWNDINRDGFQDFGEVPIKNVSVALKDPAGSVLGTAITDVDGRYKFSSGLAPFGIPANPSQVFSITGLTAATSGFSVSINTTQSALAPAGYLPTIANVNNDGSDSVDSDGTITNGIVSASFSVGPTGSINTNVDFGFYRKYALGNRVWKDLNSDGLIQPSEPGISNVSLILADSTGTPIDADPNASGIQPTSVVSDADGYYQFVGLLPGKYQIRIGSAQFLGSGPLVGLFPTVADQSGLPGIDLDSNGLNSGTTLAVGDIVSGEIRLALNATGDSAMLPIGEPTGEADVRPGTPLPDPGDSAKNFTVDFGFSPVVIPPTTTTSSPSTTTTSSTTNAPSTSIAPTTTTALATTTTTKLQATTTTIKLQATTTTTKLQATTTTIKRHCFGGGKNLKLQDEENAKSNSKDKRNYDRYGNDCDGEADCRGSDNGHPVNSAKFEDAARDCNNEQHCRSEVNKLKIDGAEYAKFVKDCHQDLECKSLTPDNSDERIRFEEYGCDQRIKNCIIKLADQKFAALQGDHNGDGHPDCGKADPSKFDSSKSDKEKADKEKAGKEKAGKEKSDKEKADKAKAVKIADELVFAPPFVVRDAAPTPTTATKSRETATNSKAKKSSSTAGSAKLVTAKPKVKSKKKP